MAFSVDLFTFSSRESKALRALSVSSINPFESRYPSYETTAFNTLRATDLELSREGRDAMEQRFVINRKTLENCDYVLSTYLEVRAPALQKQDSSISFYVWGLGYALWERATVEIGGEIIETLHSYYSEMASELHTHPGKFVKESVFKQTPVNIYDLERLSQDDVEIFVPLDFFFTKKGCHLPMHVTKEAVISIYFREIDAFSMKLPINNTNTQALPVRAKVDTSKDLHWELFTFNLWVTTATVSNPPTDTPTMLATTVLAHSGNDEGETFRQSGELLIDLKGFSRPTKSLLFAVADDSRKNRDLLSGTSDNPYDGDENSVRYLSGDRVQHIVPDFALPSGNAYSGHQSFKDRLIQTCWTTLREGSKKVHRLPPEAPFVLNMQYFHDTGNEELTNFYLSHHETHSDYIYLTDLTPDESTRIASYDGGVYAGQMADFKKLNVVVNPHAYVKDILVGNSQNDDPLLDSQRLTNKTGLLCSFIVRKRDSPFQITAIDYISLSTTFDDLVMNSIASILTKGTRNLSGFRTVSWHLWTAANPDIPNTTTRGNPVMFPGALVPGGLLSTTNYDAPTVLGMPVADEACLVTVGFQDVVEFQDANSNTVEIPRYEATAQAQLKATSSGASGYYTNTDGDLKGLFVPVKTDVKLMLGDTGVELSFAKINNGSRVVTDAMSGLNPVYSWVNYNTTTGAFMDNILDTMVTGAYQTISENALQPFISTHSDSKMYEESGKGIYLPGNRFDYRSCLGGEESATIESVQLKIAGEDRWSPLLHPSYFRTVVPTSYFQRVPRQGIYSYTFAKEASDTTKPSGLAAMGYLTNKKMKIKTKAAGKNRSSLLLYAEQYVIFDGRKFV